MIRIKVKKKLIHLPLYSKPSLLSFQSKFFIAELCNLNVTEFWVCYLGFLISFLWYGLYFLMLFFLTIYLFGYRIFGNFFHFSNNLPIFNMMIITFSLAFRIVCEGRFSNACGASSLSKVMVSWLIWFSRFLIDDLVS